MALDKNDYLELDANKIIEDFIRSDVFKWIITRILLEIKTIEEGNKTEIYIAFNKLSNNEPISNEDRKVILDFIKNKSVIEKLEELLSKLSLVWNNINLSIKWGLHDFIILWEIIKKLLWENGKAEVINYILEISWITQSILDQN